MKKLKLAYSGPVKDLPKFIKAMSRLKKGVKAA